jgi:hypothetical protein
MAGQQPRRVSVVGLDFRCSCRHLSLCRNAPKYRLDVNHRLAANFQVLERNQHEGRCTIIYQVQGLIQGALFEALGHYDETVGGLIAFPQDAPKGLNEQIRELCALPLFTEQINLIPRQT